MRFNGKKVLILGSGGLRIGQAGEFDYSGSQAIKALKAENIYTVLVNPNIATIQTDSYMADQVYLQPLNLDILSSIINKEQPNAILLGFGGQTALNLGLQLAESGVLAENKVAVLGTPIAAINKTEDRDIFKQELANIGVPTPRSICVTTVSAALLAATQLTYPLMVRSGFSLGGLGSGMVNNAAELQQRAQESLAASPQILLEESLLGWQEFEYEIVRDAFGNALSICNMENIDPMGIHTGDSIVVAPAQTLTNTEHQLLRTQALKIANHFGIIGECNIQYAVNPLTGDYRVIEMNARLSRSSALASKATGYPLAFVAAKLSLGYALHEISNQVTKKTSAFFEPALDYLVVKIPRWDIQKFKSFDRTIGTEMKSVGEVMGIGRSFAEALQKAAGMLNISCSCLSDYPQQITNCLQEIKEPTDRRIFALYQFFRDGGSIAQAQQLSQINPWFLSQIATIAAYETEIKQQHNTATLLAAKRLGFSDHAIALLQHSTATNIRKQRLAANISPVVKQIDTLAGEFSAPTNYLYLTYHGTEHDIAPAEQAPIILLGSGPYTIGSSVEFDWCSVNAAQAIRNLKQISIIINSNPETVSTDYDVSDRLYFEQLTLERVQDIADFEQAAGIIVAMGGQIANNLALPLNDAGYNILGTNAHDIDRAENREKFSSLLNSLSIDQPQWQSVTSLDSAKEFARSIAYPVLIRPSYVLSGAAINVACNDAHLEAYLQQAAQISPLHPVVISKFITDAKELEIDGVANKGEVIIEAISEHIENAGVHSGDASLVLPPQNLYLETIRRTKKITKQIIKALNITGPFNIQFIAKNNNVQVIECNLRASRSFPFVSKLSNNNFITLAIQAMLGVFPTANTPLSYNTLELDYVGVKVSQFSYQRLKGADPVQRVEMTSTGEVACLGDDILDAYWRAWLAAEQPIANKNILVSIADNYKSKFLPYLQELDNQHWQIYSTEGTHAFLFKHGVASYFVTRVTSDSEPNVKSLITNRQVDLIINIPSYLDEYNQDELIRDTTHQVRQTDGYQTRRCAIDYHIPIITNPQKALIMLACLIKIKNKHLSTASWQEIVTPTSG